MGAQFPCHSDPSPDGIRDIGEESWALSQGDDLAMSTTKSRTERITGQFDVELQAPISLDYSFTANVNPVCFSLENADIQIRPLKILPAQQIDNDWEPPALDEVRVWISKDCILQHNSMISPLASEWLLPPGEADLFEPILLKAVGWFISAVRKAGSLTGYVDIRRPVRQYSFQYSVQDQPVPTYWQFSSSGIMPQYYLYTLPTSSDDFAKGLTENVWEAIGSHTTEIIPPIYEDLLYDAMAALRQLQFESAVLFSAFACEAMFENSAVPLLRKKCLSDSQISRKLGKSSFNRSITVIAPIVMTDTSELRWLCDARDKIAHGKRLEVSGNDAHRAINITKTLRMTLSPYLDE